MNKQINGMKRGSGGERRTNPSVFAPNRIECVLPTFFLVSCYLLETFVCQLIGPNRRETKEEVVEVVEVDEVEEEGRHLFFYFFICLILFVHLLLALGSVRH